METETITDHEGTELPDYFEPEAWAAFVDNIGEEYATVEGFGDAYCGTFRSPEEYAEELARDIAPSHEAADVLDGGGQWPYSCIDWERAWRELEMGGDNYAVPGGSGVFIFRGI